MSIVRNKKFIFASFLLTFSSLSQAHDWDGNLGPSASASDFLVIRCFDNNDGAGPAEELELELLTKTSASPIVSVQVRTEEPVKIYNTTDPTGGDSNFSAPINASNEKPDTSIVGNPKNGNGLYYVTVNKTAAGAQDYHLTYHCLSATDHAGTDILSVQDQ